MFRKKRMQQEVLAELRSGIILEFKVQFRQILLVTPSWLYLVYLNEHFNLDPKRKRKFNYAHITKMEQFKMLKYSWKVVKARFFIVITANPQLSYSSTSNTSAAFVSA